eukprot:3194045-Pleurochrysis_carterae.AAC.1
MHAFTCSGAESRPGAVLCCCVCVMLLARLRTRAERKPRAVPQRFGEGSLAPLCSAEGESRFAGASTRK